MSQLVELAYKGQVDTHEQIKQLFPTISLEDRQKLFDEITPILYQFYAKYQNSQSTVYRTHDQIIKFLKKYNKKAKDEKELFTVNFEKMKNLDVLARISQLKGIHQENWFKEFFDIGTKIPGKKISTDLKKQSGGRYTQRKCCLCLKWKKCKGFILNDGIVTYDESRQKIQQFLHFGKDFTWQVSQNIFENTVYIHSHHRRMALSANSTKQFFIFTYCLDRYLKKYQKEQQQYRFNSFAPVRRDNQIKFYVDGAQYFKAIAQAIQRAHEEVYICGWWVSPEFSLIRPSPDYRLDKLLARTAKKGVKVYIIVYWQSSFLSNDSTYTIQALQLLDENIRVLRHPQIILPTFWSHHQKLVVVDQSQAYLGGLDICYGRYDDQMHHLYQQQPGLYTGIEYNNCRIADFKAVRQHTIENVDKSKPRLPWHDITIMVRGDSVKDLSRHFIQYWNFASYQTHFADRYVLVSQSNKIFPKKKNGLLQNIKQIANQIKQKIGPQKQQKNDQANQNRKSSIMGNNEEKIIMRQDKMSPRRLSFTQRLMSTIFPGKTAQKQEGTDQKETMKQQIQKQSPTNQILCVNTDYQVEMNEQIGIDDIVCTVSERQRPYHPNAVLSFEQLEQKENRKIEKTQQEVQRRANQMLRIENQIEQDGAQIQKHAQKDYLQEKKNEFPEPKPTSLQIFTRTSNRIMKKFMDKKQLKKQSFKQQEPSLKYTCQVLRSASTWSIGSKQYERSIYEAYLSLIQKAQKFIYIQNQFFISATHNDGVVKNRIMEFLANRIIRAIENKQNFKVMILMPLVPGFAGELDNPDASLPRVIMNWQYKSICRGEQSLIGRISKHTKQPGKYIQFYGLRNHAIIGEEPVTEIIYLHSKMMIVDDRFMICGSANINDRSMEGNRDSELCLLVQAQCQKSITIDGKPFKVVQKINELRTKLWQQHFGIDQYMAQNATSQKVWQQLLKTAITNTQIYRNLFGCYPDDEIIGLELIKKFRKQKCTKQMYEEQSSKIKGHAVIFPLNFLSNQKLTSYHPDAIST